MCGGERVLVAADGGDRWLPLLCGHLESTAVGHQPADHGGRLLLPRAANFKKLSWKLRACIEVYSTDFENDVTNTLEVSSETIKRSIIL